ncbi:hypothetical protein [Demequina sp.]|uniref:hypothetical protein n=1 Tax=Demequina sp. TaxID=2050685 RepID=UPI003D0CB202
MTVTGTVPAPSSRALRVVAWIAFVLVALLIAAWFVAAKNPRLEGAGMSSQSGEFELNDESDWMDADEAEWTVWDQPGGAWASIVVKNARPYPVTLAPSDPTRFGEVQVAAFDPTSTASTMDAESVTPADSLRVEPGGYALVSLRVTADCVILSPGGAIGSDAAEVKVTTFGITSTLEVPFGAMYWAGWRGSHTPDADCPAS